MKEKKEIFIKGMLTGVVSTAAVCIISVVIFVLCADVFKSEHTENLEDYIYSKTSSELVDLISSKLTYLETVISNYYIEDIDEGVLVEGVYKGLFEALDDPYSEYYDEEEYAELKESISGSYSGIGAVVSQNKETMVITVVNPYANSPAYEAGMRAGDIIYSVEGEEIATKDISDVVDKLKGEEDTSVNVTVYRDGEYIDLSIVRRKIEVATVGYQMLENNIGYIEISQFDVNTTEQFGKAMKELNAQNMEGLVIDLRNNPGGVYETVVDMLDMIMPEGTIVYTEDKYGNRETETSDADTILNVPLSVIVNENSASASEIFAGAIKDCGLGTIVGMTTYGKGVVQSVLDLGDGTGLKITTSKYYTPSGVCINGIGITPDVEVEVDYIDALQADMEDDVQLQKAIEVVCE